MSISQNDLQALSQGSGHVVSSSGDKIGGIGQIYLDDSTGEPSWVTVKTGLFGTSESFVPLDGASTSGGDITVNCDKDMVKDAPQVEADGSITPEEEQELYRYYGVKSSGTDTEHDRDSLGGVGRDDARPADRDRGRDHDRSGVEASAGDGRDRDERGDVGDRDERGDVGDRDERGHRSERVGGGDKDRDDVSVTRSEEELRVGTKTQEAGKARLRKYVVTENVTTTVPVEREEVRLEREPIGPGDGAAAGSDLGDEDVEVTLHEEVPVVEKERVAKEKVRLSKDTVTDEAQVSEELKKEQIDTDIDGVEGDDDGRGRDNDRNRDAR